MSILKIVVRFLSLLLSLYDVYRHSFSTTLLAKIQKNKLSPNYLSKKMCYPSRISAKITHS